jgi:hypothetical protein
MIKASYLYYRQFQEYGPKWKAELANILTHTDPDIKSTIAEKAERREMVSKGGVIMPIILDTLGIKREPNTADFAFSAFCLGNAIIDDTTEGSITRRESYHTDEIVGALRNREKLSESHSEDVRAAALLFEYIYNQIPQRKEEFISGIDRLTNAATQEDTSPNPGVDVRAEIGSAYGGIAKVILSARIEYDLDRYSNFLESLFAGAAILDDLADLHEDFGVKVTMPLQRLGGWEPSLLGILNSKIIQTSLADSEQEFERGVFRS